MNILTSMKNRKILIADGATGTQLQKLGLPAGYPPELWNVERPKAILTHHKAYIDAGSDIILTNIALKLISLSTTNDSLYCPSAIIKMEAAI